MTSNTLLFSLRPVKHIKPDKSAPPRYLTPAASITACNGYLLPRHPISHQATCSFFRPGYLPTWVTSSAPMPQPQKSTAARKQSTSNCRLLSRCMLARAECLIPPSIRCRSISLCFFFFCVSCCCVFRGFTLILLLALHQSWSGCGTHSRSL